MGFDLLEQLVGADPGTRGFGERGGCRGGRGRGRRMPGEQGPDLAEQRGVVSLCCEEGVALFGRERRCRGEQFLDALPCGELFFEAFLSVL